MAALVGVTSEVTGTTGTTRTLVTSGLSLQAGDILICKAQLHFTDCSSATITPPASEGWQLMDNGRLSNSTTHSVGLYWKAWGTGNTDSASADWAVTTGGKWAVSVSAWRGLNPVRPFESNAIRTGTASTTMTANGAVAAYGGRLQIRMWATPIAATISNINGGTAAWNHTDATSTQASACSYTDGVYEAGEYGEAGPTATATQSASSVYLSWTYVCIPLIDPGQRQIAALLGFADWGSDYATGTFSAQTGVLASCWMKLPTYWQNMAMPWSGKGNTPVIQIRGGNWHLECITHNIFSTGDTPADPCSLNTNSMLMAGDSETWVDDYTYYYTADFTGEQVVNSWCWCAWQAVIDSANSRLILRQWFKIAGETSYVYRESFASYASIRTAISDGAWTPGSIDTVRFGVQGHCAIWNGHAMATGTSAPSEAALDAIRDRTAPDTSALGDWPMNMLEATGLMDKADYSGNANDLTSSGTQYQAEVSPYDLGSSAIEGSGAAVGAASTAAGTGALSISGSGAASLAASVASGSGYLVAAGTGAVDTTASTASGAGTLSASGTGAAQTASSTASGAGALAITGSASASTAAPAALGSGALNILGTGEASITAPVASASGDLAIEGTSEATGAASTASSAGELGITGTGDASSDASTASASGALAIEGTCVASFAAFTAAGAGVLEEVLPPEDMVGTGAATLAASVAAGAGAMAITGTGAASSAASTASAAGNLALDGAASASTTAPTASGAGALSIVGTGAASFAASTAEGLGDLAVLAIVGTGAVQLPASTASAIGGLAIEGTGAAIFAAFTAAGSDAPTVPLNVVPVVRLLDPLEMIRVSLIEPADPVRVRAIAQAG